MIKLLTRLGLDWGEKTIGIALGLPNQRAMPLLSTDIKNIDTIIEKYVREYDVSEIVIGLPEGVNDEKIKNFGDKIQLHLGIKIRYEKEENSSNQARNLWHASNLPMRGLNKKEHSLAACEILERYLFGLGEKSRVNVE